MLESNSPSKTFLGVRFVLLGFEPVNKEKIRSKLVSGGGVDVGQYRQSCTHVIVDKLVYDDPACVAAREDGKMVVTAIWVEHSYDVGMPLDATSVMYRPRKDLNGIPGAKSLIMCLTGYQRQDREDIMTMVGLMGAQFSKPLVANKVTHLICYKFEGEKYELAKKMKKIKLVNHRWLEDCLMEWDILPEANYDKSGYELEMEAEAKDSEDEAEDNAMKQFGSNSINKNPRDVKTTTTKLADATTSKSSLNAGNSKDVLRTPVKDNGSLVVANLDNLDVSGVLSYQHVPVQRVETVGDPVYPNVKTPDSVRLRNDLASASTAAEKSPHSELKSSLSYSRKTPRRTSLSMYSVEKASTLSRSPRAQVNEFMINDCSNGFLSKVDKVKGIDTNTSARSPNKGSDLYSSELNSTLPQKRKIDNSSVTPRSPLQKTNHDADMSGYMSICDNPSPGLSVGKTVNLAQNSFAPASATKHSSFNENPSTCSLPVGHTVPGLIDNIGGKVQKTSFERSEEPTSDSIADTSGFVVRSVDGVHDKGKIQDKQHNVDHCSKRLEDEVSHSPLQLNLPKLGSNNLTTTKPLRQKTVARKNLGSRSKLCKPANRKGSIYLNEIGTQNDAAVSMSGGKGRTTDPAKSLHSDKSEVSPPNINVEAIKEVVRTDNVATPEGDVEKKTESMDDETEAPDDKYDQDFGNTCNEADTIMKEQSHGVEVQTSYLNRTVLPDIGEIMNKVESEKEESAKNLELEESTCEVDVVTEKTKKKKCPLGKSKTNSASAAKETEEVEEHGKSVAEMGMENERGIAQVAAEAKEGTVVVDLSDTTLTEKVAPEKVANHAESEKTDCFRNLEFGQSTCTVNDLAENRKKGKKRPLGKTKTKSAAAVKEHKELKVNGTNMEGTGMENMIIAPELSGKTNKSTIAVNTSVKSMDVQKENRPVEGAEDSSQGKHSLGKAAAKSNKTSKKTGKSCPNSVQAVKVLSRVKPEPVRFILSGHRCQRKEFQQVIRRLKGKVCRDSHQWSYEATHFIAPDPIRRTEKFFAAAASGRWILKMDYLTACNQAGKLLPEEPYEWHKIGLSEDGAINLEAPRKWRLLRERTGHGALYGMRVIIYGECIAPPLDTLKRAVKAGDGTILATSPPYNRFLNSGVDFAIVSAGMPRVDMWVQEFLRHEIPCVAADYLVEYVCKPGYPLEKHVLYNTHGWAEKSFANLMSRAETVVEEVMSPESGSDDITCQVCGSKDRGDVMLICGNESGSVGCGIATHIDCCDPILESVPEDDWFCQNCIRKESSTSHKSKKKRKC